MTARHIEDALTQMSISLRDIGGVPNHVYLPAADFFAARREPMPADLRGALIHVVRESDDATPTWHAEHDCTADCPR